MKTNVKQAYKLYTVLYAVNLKDMHWSERMKTKIEVGRTYNNRNGNKWKVVSKLNNTNFEIHKLPPLKGFTDISMHKQLVVNEYGGFGNYPNHFDLVKLV